MWTPSQWWRLGCCNIEEDFCLYFQSRLKDSQRHVSSSSSQAQRTGWNYSNYRVYVFRVNERSKSFIECERADHVTQGSAFAQQRFDKTAAPYRRSKNVSTSRSWSLRLCAAGCLYEGTVFPWLMRRLCSISHASIFYLSFEPPSVHILSVFYPSSVYLHPSFSLLLLTPILPPGITYATFS